MVSRVIDRAQKSRISEKSAVLNGQRDAGEILIDDPACAKDGMSDFGISHFAPWQAYRNA
jgi:hypothetical protein